MASGYDKNIHICLRTLQNCCSLPRQPSSSKPWKEHTRLRHSSLLWTSSVSFSEEVRMSDSSLWWWWLLWVSTLNFNPQQSTVLNWIEPYVLLMMAKFHTWKAGIVGWMKDPVSTLFLRHPVSFYLLLLLSVLFSLSYLTSCILLHSFVFFF